MQKHVYEINVDERGLINFRTELPEFKGMRLKIILLPESVDNEDSVLEDMLKAADEDWTDWADPQEDIYDEYIQYAAKR
jgi:hypothetical protein